MPACAAQKVPFFPRSLISFQKDDACLTKSICKENDRNVASQNLRVTIIS